MFYVFKKNVICDLKYSLRNTSLLNKRMPRGGGRGRIARGEPLETRNDFAEDTTQDARVQALENQL